ncbi:MAG: L,D-transpeptidase family protein [Candidatus Paceibacterota bacterium]|jgi:hypothetical protein|nr:L,D-transpeptidase family protein [Candidatus Paceibacterota bacterium]
MKKFLTFPLPFWAVAFLVVGMGLGMFAIFASARPTVLNYSLSLPSAEKKSVPVFSYGEQPALSDPDFFKKVRGDMLEQKTSFIEADLSQMKLYVYKAGVSVAEFPILTKGKEGSWWETPAGIYKIASKEKNHFSTFGHVYQPWSMAFQGNFFIHGWPYYSDGTPVASTYSGGCIRLSDESAQALFEMATVGMPVLVFKEEFSPDTFVYQSSVPEMTAEKYLAADIGNNFVFLGKGQSERIPLSSFDTVLGALVATDYINIEKNISLNADAYEGVSSSRLHQGEITTPFDLLHLSLRQSDPAPIRIFANYLTEKRFVSLMKEKAGALGMKDTVFSFLNDSSYTSPEDLFYLSKYIYHNRRFIFDISAGRRTNSAYSKSEFADIPNRNLFEGDPDFVGGKAITHANGSQSFFGVFEIRVKMETRPIFVYLGNSMNAKEEAAEIIQYVRSQYK